MLLLTATLVSQAQLYECPSADANSSWLDNSSAVEKSCTTVRIVCFVFAFVFIIVRSCRDWGASQKQMATMWRVKVRDGPGKELYGEHYQDIWALNRLHFKAGGERECDHVRAAPITLRLRLYHTANSRTYARVQIAPQLSAERT